MKHARKEDIAEFEATGEMSDLHPMIKLKTYLELSDAPMSTVPRPLLVDLVREYERLRFPFPLVTESSRDIDGEVQRRRLFDRRRISGRP